MEKKIYKAKCRYCGGNLSMRTRRDLNIIGEQGYSVELVCDGCKNKASQFTKYVDMIPLLKNKLLKSYDKGE